MSFSQKTGLARKTGTVIVGAALLSSLVLTACGAPAANNADSKSQSSASASAAPKELEQFDVGDAFDLSKQSTIDLAGLSGATSDVPRLLLADGVLVPKKNDKGNVTIIYTPYDGTDGSWEYATEIPAGDGLRNPASLMRWKGKSYLVLNWESKTTEEASGLKAAKTLTVTNTVVLDAATGKSVQTIKTDVVGNDEGGTFYLAKIPKTGYQNDNTLVNDPFMVGLVFRNTKTGDTKLVDPLTNATLDTENALGTSGSANNEAGFYKISNINNKFSGVQGGFGNYILATTDEQKKSNSSVSNAKFSLVDTVNKKVLSEISCLVDQKAVTTYSADFRYANFGGGYVFDTQTGKSFCARPADQKDVREFIVSAIDINGLMYGKALNNSGTPDYMRISIADNAKMETLQASVKTALPVLIDSKGSAIYQSKKSATSLVVVPAKAAKTD